MMSVIFKFETELVDGSFLKMRVYKKIKKDDIINNVCLLQIIP